LASIKKEYHTRRHAQQDQWVAWIVEDKTRKYVLLGQKLAVLAQWMNDEVIVDSTGGAYGLALSLEHRRRSIACEMSSKTAS
jgi:hypothetical protein